MNLLSSYIAERYPEFTSRASLYEEALGKMNAKLFEFPYGFFTAKKQGDAFIIFDLYTTPEARKTGKAWDLFAEIKKEAEGANVLIGFSEHCGRGHADGKGAMKAAGFIKAYETKAADIYMRGVH